MLFNSPVYLLLFLPSAIAAYSFADRRPEWRIPALLLLSLVFYSYWDVRFVAFLIPSIALNWLAARRFLQTKRGGIITLAIAANLAALGLFKYGDFVGLNVSTLLGLDYMPMHIALPLGISFFTFHHLMYLVDLRRGLAPYYPLDRYSLYICFFPQVLAGPLVRWSEVMEQFGRRAFAPGWEKRCAMGAALITLGLAQKTFLADALGQRVDLIFQHIADGALLDGWAWEAVLGFTFQIFFDFSAYTDMAIGTALIFAIELPINFNAPFRALDVRSFWRRWHITLSRFLRDYLYIPMGGNRHGLSRQILAILTTMALGGLWHGANWTFIAWGLLHGAAITVAVLWNRFGRPLPAVVAWTLTFLFVSLSFVFFRATSFSTALRVFEGLSTSPFALSGWRTIAVAAFCALALPPSHEIARRLTAKPRRGIAVMLALIVILAIAQMGRVDVNEFIYFQF